MIRVRHKGNFNNIERFFNRALKQDYLNIIADYAERGLVALRDATPTESGDTALAWRYEIERGNGITTLSYFNDNENDGVNVAILLIYGHGTKNGSYVQGNDFVTPALQPVFQDLADKIWREVTE